MSTVSILGAGAMGTALSVPVFDRGHDVRLWGTELDTEIVDTLRKGGPHPRLGTGIPSGIKLFTQEQLAQAMDGAEIVVIAVTSDAIEKIFRRALSYLKPASTLVFVTKGFSETAEGRIILLPELLKNLMSPEQRSSVPIVAVGGPSKANEVALRVPTAVTYACEDVAVARKIRDIFMTGTYRIEASSDIIGLEISAALKNTYSIALGMCEGLKNPHGYTFNNTKSALFNFAVREMALECQVAGGRGESALGLPGDGDLEVTCEAGRNRVLGELIGGGMGAKEAVDYMRSRDQAVEGYPAAHFAYRLVRQWEREGKIKPGALPFLDACYAILYEGAPALDTLAETLRKLTDPSRDA